jgi:hypothetical protein
MSRRPSTELHPPSTASSHAHTFAYPTIGVTNQNNSSYSLPSSSFPTQQPSHPQRFTIRSTHNPLNSQNVEDTGDEFGGRNGTVWGTEPMGKIGRHKPREVIRIERDWSIGTEGCIFQSVWREELEGRVGSFHFSHFIY